MMNLFQSANSLAITGGEWVVIVVILLFGIIIMAIVTGMAPESYRENELIGAPDEVFEAVASMAGALGTTDLVVNGPASGLDWRGEGYESIKLFAEQVLPAFR